MINNTNPMNNMILNYSDNRNKSIGDKAIRSNKNTFDEALKSSLNMANKKNAKNGKVVDRKLMDVCVEMESIFVAKMLKEMRKTVHKNQMFHGGFAEEIFEDMLYDEYSLQISKESNLGLAKMLYNDLSKG